MTLEQMRAYIDRFEKLAFEMRAPNPFTPRFVQLCVEARQLLNERQQYVQGDDSKDAARYRKLKTCVVALRYNGDIIAELRAGERSDLDGSFLDDAVDRMPSCISPSPMKGV
jgi:hypothetical protein